MVDSSLSPTPQPHVDALAQLLMDLTTILLPEPACSEIKR